MSNNKGNGAINMLYTGRASDVYTLMYVLTHCLANFGVYSFDRDIIQYLSTIKHRRARHSYLVYDVMFEYNGIHYYSKDIDSAIDSLLLNKILVRESSFSCIINKQHCQSNIAWLPLDYVSSINTLAQDFTYYLSRVP